MKKSFILHNDSLDVLDSLTDDQAGQIFKAIKSHQRGEEVLLDGLLQAIFIPFKNQLDRDEEKYQKIVERNKANGKKGGRPSKPKKPTGLSGNPKEPKKAHSDNDSDSDNKKDNIKEEFEKFWKAYPNKKGKDYAEECFYKAKEKKKFIIDDLLSAIEEQKKERERLEKIPKSFVPSWKNPSTWINQGCWKDEVTEKETKKIKTNF